MVAVHQYGADANAAMKMTALSLRGMTKAFGGTLAVDNVSFDLSKGEILALLGQNGAGKSTIIKMLAGVYSPDAGEIFIESEKHNPRNSKHTIAFIHQDLGLIEWMTVAENIAIAQGYPRRNGLIDWAEVDRIARQSLSMIAHNIDPDQRVSELTRAEKSLVAIARALGVKARVLVLDEPTASLPQDEVEVLFTVLRELKAQGVSMIYVSHRLDEVFAISDRLVVLRDGKLVDNRKTVDADPETLIASIIGRRPDSVFMRPPAPQTDILLQCKGLIVDDVGPIDFILHRGEILSLVGLRGGGHEQIGRALIGWLSPSEGVITLDGRDLNISTPTLAINQGLGFVAGDRVVESIASGLAVRENMFLNPSVAGRMLFHLRSPSDESRESRRLGADVDLQPNDPDTPIETLSGGNQQKVVISRWMRIGPDVLVLEDPTAGVDVGAKAEIYRLLAATLAKGCGVILISTDFEEVAAICHRALVFRNGVIAAEISAVDLSVEAVTRATSLASNTSSSKVKMA